MEQNILKRYNEIHIMLWEEVIKVFASRTSKIRGIEYYRVIQEQIETLYISSLKRTAIFNLFVRGNITEQEKNNLLVSCDCSACYIASKERDLQYRYEEYNITEAEINDLRKYMAKCIKKLNKVARINLRNAILRRIYFLEWRYKD